MPEHRFGTPLSPKAEADADPDDVGVAVQPTKAGPGPGWIEGDDLPAPSDRGEANFSFVTLSVSAPPAGGEVFFFSTGLGGSAQPVVIPAAQPGPRQPTVPVMVGQPADSPAAPVALTQSAAGANRGAAVRPAPGRVDPAAVVVALAVPALRAASPAASDVRTSSESSDAVAARLVGMAADGAMAAAQSVVLATVERFLGTLPFSPAQGSGQDAVAAPVSAAVPAAAVTMVEAAGGPARTVVGVGQAVAAGVQTAVAVLPRTVFYFPRIDPAAFNDAMAAFIADNVATPQPPAAASRRRVRAWVVTAVVMAADAALLFSWHKPRPKRSLKGRSRPPKRHRGWALPQSRA